jgi:transposase-like protein
VTKGRCRGERRQYAREFKLLAIRRMEEAGNVRALAEELGVRRELLYGWRAKYAAGGLEALRNSGRPRPTAHEAVARSDERRIGELERELERKIGEQALLIDFFKGALRRIEASRQANGEPGATVSSRRSKR